MKRLWAPWRKAYIRPKKKKADTCLFCTIGANKKDSKNLVLARGEHCFVVLNLYPYNNGHVMVVPYRHVASFDLLSDSEKLDWLSFASDAMKILRSKMNAQGFNVGLNLGIAAGAGIPDHAHLHIVPRWQGDHNFMPVLSNTKVISESLQSAYDLIYQEFKKMSPKTK